MKEINFMSIARKIIEKAMDIFSKRTMCNHDWEGHIGEPDKNGQWDGLKVLKAMKFPVYCKKCGAKK